jgi:hypothetical protein
MTAKSYKNIKTRRVCKSICANCTKILWWVRECKEEGAEIVVEGRVISKCTGFEKFTETRPRKGET